MPAMLKGYFDRVMVAGAAWTFPPENGAGASSHSHGLVPLLTNVHRVLGISTYGASRTVNFFAGDNGRNCIGTAVRPTVFDANCTCAWLGLYGLDTCSNKQRQDFVHHVRCFVRDEL
jgi:putative NADPH-quinone reductase